MRLLAVVFLALAVAWPREMPACAVVPRKGDRVGVQGEEAIIIHDAKAGVEHFIRRAMFQSESPEFGFLVPTPSQPSLGEADSALFDRLASVTAARREFSGVTHRIVRKGMYEGAAAKSAPERPRVVEEKEIAGFNAKVLQAEDVEGLRQWLEEHQFDARPSVMDWLKWYVEKKWFIVAFKIAHTPGASSARQTKTPRLTFKTAQPFYPYREPAEMQQAAGQRKLRVYLLSDSRMTGGLGEQRGAWTGQAVWFNPLDAAAWQLLTPLVGLEAAGTKLLNDATWRLTEFEDQASPRPGTHDLWFAKADDQSTFERPVIYYDKYDYIDAAEQTLVERLGNDPWLLSAVAAVVIMAIALIGCLLILRRRRRVADD